MSTTRLTRRAALAGAAALPVLPAAAMATSEIPKSAEPNATDAAWASYLVARAEVEAAQLAGVPDEWMDAAADALIDWEAVVKEAPTVTVLDVARKLAIAATGDDSNDVPREQVDRLLAHLEGAGS